MNVFGSRFRQVWRQQAQAFRRFSTEELPKQEMKKPKTKFQKIVNFVVTNKQQLLNVIAVYFVFSFSVHNYKMQEAWKEQEKLVNELKEENSRLKNGFDEAWYDEAEAAIKSSKAVKDTLATLIKKAHSNERTKADDVNSSKVGKKDSEVEDLAALASAVTASAPSSGSNAKGKLF